MKRKLATVLTMLIITGLLLCTCSSVVNAKEKAINVPTIASGIIIPSDEEIKAYYSSMSSKQKSALERKTKEAFSFSSEKKASYRSMSTIPGSFTIYPQINDNWCGPASVKSILQYINGSSLSQGTYACWMGSDATQGVTTSSLLSCLNAFQSSYNYDQAWKCNLTKASMKTLLKYTTCSAQVPTCMYIATYYNWFYNTSSHCTVVYGVDDSLDMIQIADPYGGYLPTVPQYYSKSASTCYDVALGITW